MVKPIDPRQTVRYVAKCDRELPAEDQTIWPLRLMTVRERRHVDNRTSAFELGDDGTQRTVSRDGDSLYWPLKICLGKPENFAGKWVDENNLIDPNAPQLARDSFLNQIPNSIRVELALEAIKLQQISEQEEGKSSPQPTSTSADPVETAATAGEEQPEAEEEALPATE